MKWWKPWKWSIPRRPTMKPNTYDSIYSMKSNTKKSSWWKKQGKETLKVLPKMVVTAAVGARVMVGASIMARPNQIHSGDDLANRENQALFIHNNSKLTCLNTLVHNTRVGKTLHRAIRLMLLIWLT